LQLDDKLNVIPCIAKSWKISEDGLIYTFTLRDDVYFHDHILFLNSKGRKVRASDFVNSFLRITDKDIASPGAWVFNNVDRSASSNYKGFVDINDTTLKVFLTKPFPPFLGLLTMQYCAVVPIEIAQYYGAEFRNLNTGRKGRSWY
jgi:peptide/nickel transport system substrate-binding protein